jgi:rhodanese-related sulfurtransferase
MGLKQFHIPAQLLCLLWILYVVAGQFLSSAAIVQAEEMGDRQKYNRVLAIYEDYREKFPNVTEIGGQEALRLLSGDDVVFVDVRKTGEQKISMIPGAVTKGQFLDNIEIYRQKKIVAYCTIGYRSGKFAEKMEKKGVAVFNLQAGLLGWVHVHGPLVSQNSPTNTLHVYGKTWDLAPSWIATVY